VSATGGIRSGTGSAVLAEDELIVVVARKEQAAEGVVVLTLIRPDDDPLPEWSPGAHLDLLLGPGLERQYSLCGDPADRSRYQVAVLREPESRGGSVYVHDRLAVGDTVGVRGPRNHFLLEPAPRYTFIAGGIGITPILPMIAAVDAAGAEWELVYGGRRRASMAFCESLTSSYGERVRLWPQDEHGLLPLDEVLATPRPDTLIYCCGPEPLLQAVEQRCAAWPTGALHVERFSPKEVGEPVRSDAFRVTCRRSGMTVVVPPERSILEVLEEAGAPVVSSCREGTCGTCETDVISGRPDHRDSVLTPDEQESGETMMLCVSRSLDDELVLDI